VPPETCVTVSHGGPPCPVLTPLVEAGVNVQHAMHLASHWDAKVHSRYVMSTKVMRTIPEAALPRLPAGPLPEAIGRVDSHAPKAPPTSRIVTLAYTESSKLDGVETSQSRVRSGWGDWGGAAALPPSGPRGSRMPERSRAKGQAE
jgi:hypothetical protein